MRLHRGAPVNISSSDLTGRQDTSRMSTSQVGRRPLIRGIAVELESVAEVAARHSRRAEGRKTNHKKTSHFLFRCYRRRQTCSLFALYTNVLLTGRSPGETQEFFFEASEQAGSRFAVELLHRPAASVGSVEWESLLRLCASMCPLFLCPSWALCSPMRSKCAIATNRAATLRSCKGKTHLTSIIMSILCM